MQTRTSTTSFRLNRTALMTALMFGVAATASAQQRTSHEKAVVVKEAKPGLAARATIPAATANASALAAVPGGRIREAEIEEEKGRLVYAYDIKVPGRGGIEEVLIDAKTGVVVSKSHETALEERREAASEGKGEKMEATRGANERKERHAPAAKPKP